MTTINKDLERGTIVSDVGFGDGDTLVLRFGARGVVTKTGDTSFSLEERDRIIKADAERTFSNPCNQKIFMEVMTELSDTLGDYSQSMGYVASFLLLSHTDTQTVDIMLRLQTLLPGYWTFKPTAVVTDGYVLFHHFMDKVYRDALLSAGVMPETYVTKWFSGMFVHILGHKAQTMLIQGVLDHGKSMLFRMALVVLDYIKDEVMVGGVVNVTRFFEKVRLPGVDIDSQCKLVKSALVMDLGDDYDFELLGEEIYDKYLRSRDSVVYDTDESCSDTDESE